MQIVDDLNGEGKALGSGDGIQTRVRLYPEQMV